MSRAYRIRVSESLRRVLRAEDHISTQLELLGVLPPEQLGTLLGTALEERGFTRQGDVLVRKEGDVTVTVDPGTGKVTARAARQETVDLEKEADGHAYDDVPGHGRRVEENLKKELGRVLQAEADRRQTAMQAEVTGRLEQVLAGLGQDLNAAVNRATAEALKIKAAQLGQIKELTEDPQSGSLTIVVEV